MKTTETISAEQATGCSENPFGIGKCFAGPINRKGKVSDPGTDLPTREAAMDWLEQGGAIAFPNAGAGSSRKVFCGILGFQDLREIDTTSSAGDWSFGVFDGEVWIAAFQSNRYPRHGFTYSLSRERQADSFEELCRMLEF